MSDNFDLMIPNSLLSHYDTKTQMLAFLWFTSWGLGMSVTFVVAPAKKNAPVSQPPPLVAANGDTARLSRPSCFHSIRPAAAAAASTFGNSHMSKEKRLLPPPPASSCLRSFVPLR